MAEKPSTLDMIRNRLAAKQTDAEIANTGIIPAERIFEVSSDGNRMDINMPANSEIIIKRDSVTGLMPGEVAGYTVTIGPKGTHDKLLEGATSPEGSVQTELNPQQLRAAVFRAGADGTNEFIFAGKPDPSVKVLVSSDGAKIKNFGLTASVNGQQQDMMKADVNHFPPPPVIKPRPPTPAQTTILDQTRYQAPQRSYQPSYADQARNALLQPTKPLGRIHTNVQLTPQQFDALDRAGMLVRPGQTPGGPNGGRGR